MCDCHNDTTHNGWPNWATWNVALWWGNDESLYRCWEEARVWLAFDEWSPEIAESYVRERQPNGTPDMQSKGPNPEAGSMFYRNVDWQAIADAWNETD